MTLREKEGQNAFGTRGVKNIRAMKSRRMSTVGLRMMYAFEPFSGPIHLGPKTGPLCHASYARLRDPCCVTETRDGPHA